MSDRKFMINRKCLAALRAMGDGKWSYAHVSGKGVICTDGTSIIARVSLPKILTPAPSEARVFAKSDIAEIGRTLKDAEDLVTLPEGLEARTGQRFTVPALEKSIPDANAQTASIIVDAKQLISLLKMACEVTDHARHLVKLRLCGNAIRVDSHRVEGEQEFVGVLTKIAYNGNCIPGEPDTNKPVNEAVDQQKLVLPNVEGRRFR